MRRYRERVAGTRMERVVSLSVQVNADAVAQAESCLGWHVYVTTQPAQRLSLEQAMLAYREEYLIERGFGRLKGRPLSVSPLQLTSEQRVKGLLRLLSLGLRVLCLLEYQVRSQLAEQQQALTGLYAGNPKRTTRRPRHLEISILNNSVRLNKPHAMEELHLDHWLSPIFFALGRPSPLKGESYLQMSGDGLPVRPC